MSRHTQGSLAIVGAIGAGIFLVAMVALMVLGEYGFSAAAFLALLVALLATIVLYLGFGGSMPSGQLADLSASKSAPASAPSTAASDASKAEASAMPAARGATTAPVAEPEPSPAPVSSSVPEPSPEPEPAPEPTPEPAVSASAESTPDYDGDGVHEGENEGTRPAGLDGPRDGNADDLKQIKGVGPKMEQLCNSLGFWHFDQIANWTPDEVAWVDANLEGFKGRVTRDNWVEQAKVLAAGGETEFSKRVEDGGVY